MLVVTPSYMKEGPTEATPTIRFQTRRKPRHAPFDVGQLVDERPGAIEREDGDTPESSASQVG